MPQYRHPAGLPAARRYAIYGAAFGLCFPLIATLLDIYLQGLAPGWAAITQVQGSQPLHWVIDSAPVFLGLFAWFAGKRQDQLASFNAQLEKIVENRTRSLAQANEHLNEHITQREGIEEALRQSQREAENANRAKSEFLSNMSHELRTPMNGLLGMIELLRQTGTNEDQQRLLDLARESGTILLHMVEEILDLSRIETGKMKLHIADFDPHQLLDDAMAIHAPSAGKKHLALRAQFKGISPGKLRGDPHRLGQIIGNLLSNAIKFTENGLINVECEVIPVTDDRVGLRVAVEDTGIGIEDAAQQRIFDIFSQADASSTRRFGGTGLGLTIARHLITMMGGEIGLRSSKGEGSTFWFRLELAVAPHAPAAPDTGASSSAVPLAVAASAGEPLRVLVAEDNTANQQYARKVLEKGGHEVEIVANGREAVMVNDRFHPEVILMDCQMPVMDGFEATRQIRSTCTKPLVIIALTANARAEDRQQCLDAGMDDYLSKPYTPQQLWDMLAKHTPARHSHPVH